MLPQRARLRVAKRLYNYESPEVLGIDMVAPLKGDGLVCFINTKDLIGWKIFFFGEYEGGTNRALERYVRPGDVVIEAGANMGSETVLLSRMVGDAGHVYGFEPNPYTYERLSMNVAINELKNVSIYDLAIGEKDGEVSFNIYPKGFCNPGMSSKYMSTPQTKKITVPQRTLDSFVAEKGISRVNFLKMDIQGAEMDLLNGADGLLERDRPTIFMEALREYNDITQLYNRMKKYGYKIYLIDDEKLEHMSDVAAVRDGNWLATCNK